MNYIPVSNYYWSEKKMKLKNLSILCAVLMLSIAILTACGTKPASETAAAPAEEQPQSEAAPAATDEPLPTEAPEPTAPPSIQVDAPAAGMSNAYGRVYWNSAPVAGTDVKLCNDVSFVSGCDETDFATTTDEDGVYIFKDLTPGEYVIMVKVPSSEYWVYVTTSFGISAEKQSFNADETHDLGVQNIIRYDLMATYPQNDGDISEARPVLDWDDYADAVNYEVYLSPSSGSSFSDTVSESTYSVPADLLNCDYTWMIKAYNANGEEIAEFEEYNHFIVSGQSAGCTITLKGPADGSEISGSGIVLEWEAHPQADKYMVYISDMDYNNLIDGSEVTGTTFEVPTDLEPGEYQWYIAAYKGYDSIATSSFYKFTVK